MNDTYLLQFLIEQNILNTVQTKVIVDAIKKKRKITFDYYGPRTPKRDSVKPGKRIKAEPYAIGLSKKGNLIIRMWVEPPSVSKKGFLKTNWRTFMVSRMKNIVVTDEIFTRMRDKYNGGGNDKSMTVTYVSADFSTTPPEPKKPTITKQTRNVDAELKKFDVELNTIEKDIQTNLNAYKNTKGTPDEKKYIQQLKDLNKKKNELLNKIQNTISSIGKDVKPEDKAKISDFTRRVSAKKKEPETLIPIPSEKPPKKPNQKNQEPEVKDEKLPEVPKKEKPSKKPDLNTDNLNEGYVNRIKKLISYF